MTNAQTLLTRLKAALGGASNYKAAKILQISESAISRVYTGQGGFSDETMFKIAHELGENPHILIADYHIATNDFPAMTDFFKEMKQMAEQAERLAALGEQSSDSDGKAA